MIFKKLGRLAPYSLIVAAAVIVHARVLKYPLIQDDWIRIEWVQVPDRMGMLVEAFSPFDKGEYRPFGAIYFLIVANVFRMNAAVTHIVALVLHSAASVLVALVLGRILRDRFLGWAGGMLFAGAALIHMDPLLWASGIFENASAFLGLLSVWLFLNGSRWRSVAAYACALLFKESVIFLPALIWTLAWSELDGPSSVRVRSLFRRSWMFGIVAVAHAGLKLLGESPLTLEDTHPYALRFSGPHVLANIGTYGRWMVSALCPTCNIDSPEPAVVLLAIVSAGLALLLVSRWREGVVFSEQMTAVVAFAIWFAGAIGLVLFLPNHVYRYYLTLAWPAAVGLLLLTVQLASERMRMSIRFLHASVALAVTASLSSSFLYFRAVDRRGLNQAYVEGTNDLVRRGRTVMAVRTGLFETHPSLPPGAVLVFEGVELWSFGKEAGPRIWYGDPAIRVYDARHLANDQGTWVIQNPVESQVEAFTGPRERRVPLDCCPVFMFALLNGELIERPLPTLSEQGAVSR